MTRTSAIVLGMILLLAASLFLITHSEKSSVPGTAPIVLHCAAGLREPVTEIAKLYEQKFGVPVHLQFGGSGALESQLQVAGGDLYLPADDSYISATREKGFLLESIPVATLTAGIVVPKGNPKNIRTLDDLTRPGIRLSIADTSAAIGKHTQTILENIGKFAAIKPNITVTKPTVNNIVEDVATAAVDATIAWDAVASSFPEVEWIAVPAFSAEPKHASIGLLASSRNAARALHFARFLTARDQGLTYFAKAGFTVPEQADLWADTPELTLFSGSMLRPAIQELIREFEQREGCRITTVFEGCGTLVAMMKNGGSHPAAFFSCDTKFLDRVADRFDPGTIVSQNEIILLVPKGNPKQLESLTDLTRPGLKLGLCDPQKSALGFLTRQMLDRRQLGTPLDQSGNLALLSGDGDDLVNAMQANSLDAALVYHSNALASPAIKNSCDIIALNDPLALATQPYAVAKDTAYPQLTARLGEYLSSPSARPHFEDLGFTWKK